MDRTLEPEVMDTIDDAHDYDAMDHTAPNRAFVDRLKQLGATGRMLDLGTGPGHIPIMVAQEIGDASVMALDLSKNMLELAKEKLAAVALGDRVEFHLADVKDLPFDDRAFDVVFSNTILHHIPEPVEMLREAWRVLKPDGILLIRDLYRPPDEATLDALVQQHVGRESEHARKMFRDSLCAALTPDELRAAANAAGMQGVEVVIDTDRHMSLQKSR
ncbi:MAG: class I SAM-dependent methyltransferase [Phycisphaeraceae bacterium]